MKTTLIAITIGLGLRILSYQTFPKITSLIKEGTNSRVEKSDANKKMVVKIGVFESPTMK